MLFQAMARTAMSAMSSAISAPNVRAMPGRRATARVWLAQREDADLGNAFPVVGPIHGLEAKIFELLIMELAKRFSSRASRISTQ
jgi:hypothetical protein